LKREPCDWLHKNKKNELKFRQMGFLVFGIAAISTLSLAYTAKQGGQIRHPELRPQSIMQAVGDLQPKH
jgi:hypothetical protein